MQTQFIPSPSAPSIRVRVQLVRESDSAPYVATPGKQVRSPADLAAVARPHLEWSDRERIIVIALDSKHRVLCVEEVSTGTVSQCLAHPREIFKGLILANATAFALAHHHPSGDPTPSDEDIAITQRMRECGDLLGIKLIDHVVIGGDNFESLIDRA